MLTAPNGRESGFQTLRRFAQPQSGVEVCEFCSVGLGSNHRHLLEAATRKIVCVCDACALLFEGAMGRYKLIPRDARLLPDFRMEDAQWEALAVPINLAFFFHSTPAHKVVALYPSPAGATESLLPLTNWEKLLEANACLTKMQPDVEALLVNRLGGAHEHYIAPIDLCFEMVGLIRLHWKGFSGGDKVWEAIEKFFAKIRPQTQSVSATAPEAACA